MNSIIPPITTPGISTGTDTSLPQGSMDVSGTVLEGIKPGMSLQLTLPSLSQGNLNLSVKIEINNQTLEIPLKLNQNLRFDAPLEGEFPVEIKVLNNHQGEIAFKFVSPGFNGVPDRIILVPMGRIYFVETKAPGGKLRKLQRYVNDLIKELGFKVMLLDSREKI